jgi:hypothetical protein
MIPVEIDQNTTAARRTELVINPVIAELVGAEFVKTRMKCDVPPLWVGTKVAMPGADRAVAAGGYIIRQ